MTGLIKKSALRRMFWLAGVSLFVAAQPVAAGEKYPPPQNEPKASENEKPTEDPFESINRITSGFNTVVRQGILDPLVTGFKTVTPEPVQEAVSNAVSNLTEPLTIGSSLLQGDTENATVSTKRFFINSTVGLGGTSDPATGMGLEQRREDLGQAFGSNGVEPGPHIVLPLIGPSNMRDATGDILSALASPLPLVAKAASSGVTYSNNQEDIQALTSGALDPYVVERNSYEQNRRYEVNNGVAPLMDIPEFAEEKNEKKSAK